MTPPIARATVTATAFASPLPLLSSPRSHIACTSPLRVTPPRRPAQRLVQCAQATSTQSAVSAASNGAVPDSADSDPPTHLSAAIRARTVTHICKSATLCTASTRHDGVPFGSHVDYVQDDHGHPVFLLAGAANHTRNLTEEPRCSIFCQPAAAAGQDGCRATLVGHVTQLPSEEEEELRELYIETHAHAVDALKVPDFQFYRMRVDDVLFVAGYGVTSKWVDAQHFANAAPDPLAFDAPAIVTKLNETKEPDLLRLCRVILDVDNVVRCSMTALDRLGFDLRTRDDRGNTREYRVAFRQPVQNRFDVQSTLVKAFQETWERENGFDNMWQGDDGIPSVVFCAGSL